MPHIVGSIKDRRLGYLEQTCERYAVMVYEVLRRELAIGFKSIKYSYGAAGDNTGTFTATFIPWKQTNEYKHGHRSTEVKFQIDGDSQNKEWIMSKGTVTDIESSEIATIRFTHGCFRRVAINIPYWNEIRFASNADHQGEEAVTPLNKEPWANLYDSIQI